MKGNVLGRIDLALTPYIIEPLERVGDHRVKWLGAVAPTQSGKTVFLQGALADMIDQDPGPALYILPDEKSGRKHVEKKIIDVIKETPCLAEHMTGRARDISKQGIELDNMTIWPAWAGSNATISSFAMKRVFLDEVRLMPLTQGDESNAIKLAGDRLTTYMDMGLAQGYIVSTPSIEGDLLHQQLSVRGTLVLRWHVPCPECGKYQRLEFFENLIYNREDKSVKCLCKFCGGEFRDDDKKVSWNANGVYAPEDAVIFDNGELAEPYEICERMFYRWSSMESPFRSFKAIWTEYLITKDKIQDYKNFIQCWLAEFWVEDISKTTIENLSTHQGKYTKRDIPVGTKVIMGGIDTQDDGFYVTMRAFGSNKKTFLIDEFFLPCPIETATQEEITEKLGRDVMDLVYASAAKEKWRPALVGIDTGGHRTKMLYNVCSNFQRMIMVKGKDNQTATWSYNKDLNLYLVRTCEYLDETELRCESDSWLLPANVSADYKRQFCNIRKVKEQNKKNGEIKVIWKKIGQCDYRFADIHTFICLDIPTDRGIIRNMLEDNSFKMNPYQAEKVQTEVAPSNTNFEEQETYDIGTRGNWW